MIKDKIHTIRDKQVILDRDLAGLYKVEVKYLKRQVRRNINRFPSNFMFQLNKDEFKDWRGQFVTSKSDKIGLRYHPYVFTEQGVAMLSGILRSDKAVDVSINIINAFVAMRKFLSKNANIFTKFQQIDQKLIDHDNNFDKVFKALETEKPKQGIFFDGQIFDAYKFVNDLIKTAKKSIILIDNYVDYSTLSLFCDSKVNIKVYTKNISSKLKLDLEKYNEQYKNITIKEFTNSHDRFLIIDNNVYHFGASLKDLGKRWFGFSKFGKEAFNLLEKLK